MRWPRGPPSSWRTRNPAALARSYGTASVVSRAAQNAAIGCNGLTWGSLSGLTVPCLAFLLLCLPGSCSVGTFYSGEQEDCVQCPPGTYQDMEGQLSCEPCPSTEVQGIAGAKNVSECGGGCRFIPGRPPAGTRSLVVRCQERVPRL